MPSPNNPRGALASFIFVVSMLFVSSCQDNVTVPIAEGKQDPAKPLTTLTAQQKQQVEDVKTIIHDYMGSLVGKIKDPKDRKDIDITGLSNFVNNELAKQKKNLVKFFSGQPSQTGKEKATTQALFFTVYASYGSYGYKTNYAVGWSYYDFHFDTPVYWYADYWLHAVSMGYKVQSDYIGSAWISTIIPFVPSPSVNANAIQMVAFAYDNQGYLNVGASEYVWYGVPEWW